MNIGCSSFSWATKDGRHLLGRTYDQFGDLKINQIISVPPGTPCALELSPDQNARPGRYGYTGMAVLGFGSPVLVDGVNTAGLMGALLHYPGYAVYRRTAEPGKTAVHPGRLLAWLLSRCAGLEDAMEVLSALTLVDQPILGKPLAAHYLLSDGSGRAIVLEPEETGLRLHRDTIGVLTNSPDYLWHQTNLRNYVGVTNLPKPPRMVADHQIREFGERLGGGAGLPGDYSSPSRFVRLAFMKEFAVLGENELDGVSRMFRAFAPVDIPEGLAKADSDGEEYEQTLCTSVMCAESGIYYFTTAQNRRISAVRPMQGGRQMECFTLEDEQDVDYRN